MGPRKYCLYSEPIGRICCIQDLLYHCYVDNIQVYIAILLKETRLDVSKNLETCLVDISNWVSANMLKLIKKKTQLITFNPKYKSRRMTEDIQFHVDEKTVRVADSAKNLGVYFDTSLTMGKQVNAISKDRYYRIPQAT